MSKKNLNLRLLSDRLMIEPQEKEGKTNSGIILPERSKENPRKGTVLAAGPGRTDDNGQRIKMDVKPGDVVLYSSHVGARIKFDGRKLLIINESDILAIFET